MSTTHPEGASAAANYEERIAELGYRLPEPAAPIAAYVPALRVGDLVMTSGQIPVVDGEIRYRGKVGADISLDEAREAARICALNGLAAVKALIGDLNAIERIVKVVGYVNSTPDYADHPLVVNGASELFQEVFGDAGRHVRAAVGCGSLPAGVAVEVELTVQLKAGL